MGTTFISTVMSFIIALYSTTNKNNDYIHDLIRHIENNQVRVYKLSSKLLQNNILGTDKEKNKHYLHTIRYLKKSVTLHIWRNNNLNISL